MPVPEADTPVPAEPVPPASTYGVGPTLRAARDRKGKTVAECAAHLRIRQPFLEALEDGRHRDLPGGTYAAGFLRSYADYLNLDGEELIRRFRQEGAGGFAVRSELSFPSPASEGRIPGGALIFLGLILAAVAYGGWYLLSSRETNVAEMVPPLPERLSNLLARPATLTGEAKTPAEAGKASPETARPAEEPVKAREDVVPPAETEEEKPAAAQPAVIATAPPRAEEPPAASPAPPAESPAAETPKIEFPKVEISAEGKIYGSEYPDSRVVLKAAGDDCWIQVREMDGSLLMSRLLRKGDVFRVPNRPGLSLMAGNAGALEASIDGRKGPSLGGVGQVRRDIRLDPDKLGAGG